VALNYQRKKKQNLTSKEKHSGGNNATLAHTKWKKEEKLKRPLIALNPKKEIGLKRRKDRIKEEEDHRKKFFLSNCFKTDLSDKKFFFNHAPFWPEKKERIRETKEKQKKKT